MWTLLTSVLLYIPLCKFLKNLVYGVAKNKKDRIGMIQSLIYLIIDYKLLTCFTSDDFRLEAFFL